MSSADKERAACRGVDVSIFYPVDSRWDDRAGQDLRWAALAAPALQYCNICPTATKAACLREAIATGDAHGIRGGLTPPELRRLIRQARDNAGHGTRRRYLAGCDCAACETGWRAFNSNNAAVQRIRRGGRQQTQEAAS